MPRNLPLYQWKNIIDYLEKDGDANRYERYMKEMEQHFMHHRDAIEARNLIKLVDFDKSMANFRNFWNADHAFDLTLLDFAQRTFNDGDIKRDDIILKSWALRAQIMHSLTKCNRELGYSAVRVLRKFDFLNQYKDYDMNQFEALLHAPKGNLTYEAKKMHLTKMHNWITNFFGPLLFNAMEMEVLLYLPIVTAFSEQLFPQENMSSLLTDRKMAKAWENWFAAFNTLTLESMAFPLEESVPQSSSPAWLSRLANPNATFEKTAQLYEEYFDQWAEFMAKYIEDKSDIIRQVNVKYTDQTLQPYEDKYYSLVTRTILTGEPKTVATEVRNTVWWERMRAKIKDRNYHENNQEETIWRNRFDNEHVVKTKANYFQSTFRLSLKEALATKFKEARYVHFKNAVNDNPYFCNPMRQIVQSNALIYNAMRLLYTFYSKSTFMDDPLNRNLIGSTFTIDEFELTNRKNTTKDFNVALNLYLNPLEPWKKATASSLLANDMHQIFQNNWSLYKNHNYRTLLPELVKEYDNYIVQNRRGAAFGM